MYQNGLMRCRINIELLKNNKRRTKEWDEEGSIEAHGTNKRRRIEQSDEDRNIQSRRSGEKWPRGSTEKRFE